MPNPPRLGSAGSYWPYRLPVILLFAAASLTSWHAAQAEPTIRAVTPRGLVIGGETLLTIEGTELTPKPRLVLQVPGATATLEGEPLANKATFRVQLPSSARAGHVPIRVVNGTGLSAATTLGVDLLPEATFGDSIESLPLALTGQLTGNQLLETQFTGNKGQRVVVDVEAQRLGSRLNPVVRLLDERKTQIAWSAELATIDGDARLETLLPADGQYTIQLHDRLYKGTAPGHFRLKVGDFRYADLAFPPAVSPTRPVAIEYLQAETSTASLRGLPWKGMDRSVSKMLSVTLDERPFSGPRPTVLVSDLTELIEADASSGEPETLPPAPVAVSGRLSEPGQRDRYLVPVPAGQKVIAQVVADAIGSPLDAVIEVHTAEGKPLGSNDDPPGSVDPRLEFDVPAEVEQVVVTVRHLHDEGSPLHVYRLVVRPQSMPEAILETEAGLVNIPAGGQVTFKVTAGRRNLPGEIQLALPDLPSDIQATGTSIPAGANQTLVTLHAAADSKSFAIGPILATAQVNEKTTFRRAVSIGGEKWTLAHGSGLADLAIGVVDSPPLTITWEDAPENPRFDLGETLPINVKIARGEGTSGKVRLSLLTSQTMPRKEAPDPKDANKKVQVDDLDKALHLAESPVLEADQSAIQLNLKAPLESIADIPWDVAVVAELLSADEKTVIATATTAAQRYVIGSPPR
ncbi:MAG: IPT/TIG domain-containing protein [Pirellulaceae bacterium]